MAGALALLALGSCAPRTTGEPGLEASTTVTRVGFYPAQAGMQWTYLPEGEAAGGQPYVLRALGPTLFAAQEVSAFTLTGRGAEQTWFRQISGDGVRLLGLRKPGLTVQLSPAWRELPGEAEWRVGLAWEGQSRVTVTADDGRLQADGTLNYRYVVQERRAVQTPAGRFDVWVVTRQLSDTVGGLFPATQQLWFAPFVGEVRTPEGLLLTSRNFQARSGAVSAGAVLAGAVSAGAVSAGIVSGGQP